MTSLTALSSRACLNEVQLPKELQPQSGPNVMDLSACLNEVQLPKELQPRVTSRKPSSPGLNEVQLPKELQHRPLQCV